LGVALADGEEERTYVLGAVRGTTYHGERSPVRERKAFSKTRALLVVMLVLQLLWLATIVWTGTSTNWSVIVPLAAYSLLLGVAVILLPARPATGSRVVNDLIRWAREHPAVALGLAAVVIGTLYAFIHTPWGDEERSLRAASLVSSDGLAGAYEESGWLRNKHPPLMPLVFGSVVRIAGPGLLALRLVSVVFLVATCVVVYLLGRELLDRNAGIVAAIFFLSFPLVVRLGSAAMMDIQVTFFFAAGLLLCLRLVERPSYRLAVAAGLVIGAGLLTKYVMVLFLGVLGVAVLVLPSFRKAKAQLGLAAATSLALFGLWLAYAAHLGILQGQVEKILDYSGITHVVTDVVEGPQPGPLVGEGAVPQPDPDPTKTAIFRLGLETLVTRLPSSFGVHLFPLILAGGVLALRRRATADRLLIAWIGVVFVTLFLTLPDHRYFLSAFPAVAILIAGAVMTMPEARARLVLLGALLGLGNLYLFVDWVREAHLFVA
jgi:4-amino-4-deoxy-L-arabinose transferase-like glycosyltransferase